MKNLFTLLALFLIISILAQAQTPSIKQDSAFGKNGIYYYFDSACTSNGVFDIQKDGKMIIAMNNNYPVIARYNADGSLDKNFPGDFVPLLTKYGYARGWNTIKVLPDGKILAAGKFGDQFKPNINFIVRFTSDGIVDTTYGISGYAIMDPDAALPSLFVLSDGSARYVFRNSSSPLKPFIMKVSSTGVIDNNYGTNGKLAPTNAIMTFGGDFLLDHNDRIVIVAPDNNNKWQMQRIMPDGSYDQSFGNNGFTGPVVDTNTHGQQVAGYYEKSTIEPDNSIIVVFKNITMFASHILANGVHDYSYGNQGLSALAVISSNQTPIIQNVIALDNGATIIQTSTYFNGGTFSVLAADLQALSPTGHVDKVFPNDTAFYLLQYDSVNNGSFFTSINSIKQVPGKNQIMMIGTSGQFSKNLMARLDYSGFPSGIRNFDIHSPPFFLYPNPTSGLCTIHIPQSANNKYSAILTDLTGKEVCKSWSFMGASSTFDVSSYPKGIYILHVSDNNGQSLVKKFLVE